MKHDSRLIQKPQAQPRAQRATWGLVTALFWAVYLYLWLPLATLILWLLGVRLAALELYLRQNQIEPFLLLSMPVLAFVAAAMLIGWAEINRWRFVDREKRSVTPEVRHDQVATALGATPAVAKPLQAGKIVVLHMNDDATPHAVHTLSHGTQVQAAVTAVA